MIVQARFVVPVDSEPIENGAIQFEHGMIVAVGHAEAFSASGCVDYGDAVILPGMVNAHTHLELSLLAGRVAPSPDFTDWLTRLIAARNLDLSFFSSSKGEGGGEGGEPDSGDRRYFARAVESGIWQSITAGVTAIADITANPYSTRPILTRSPLHSVSFGEVIAMGKGRTLLQARLDAAMDGAEKTGRMNIGISPHAPYSVEPDALRACVNLTARNRWPLSMHVAETPDEELFTRERKGSFADFLARLGIWDEQIPISRCSPLELLASVGALTPSTILAHANYVSDSDIALIAGSGASVAYCPRTHAAFGHAPHRFRDMLAAGINVCLGTDSLASNPSLSVLDEVRFLRGKFGDISPDLLISLATRNGARALQLDSQIGSLRAGRSADFCVVPLEKNARSWSSVLETAASPIATYIGGKLTGLLANG